MRVEYTRDKFMYDLVIIGAGPAGIFTAFELLKRGTKKKILMVEKGHAVEHRHCPKDKIGHCIKCDPCAITTGFSGAGAFSDGKLSLSHAVITPIRFISNSALTSTSREATTTILR